MARETGCQDILPGHNSMVGFTTNIANLFLVVVTAGVGTLVWVVVANVLALTATRLIFWSSSLIRQPEVLAVAAGLDRFPNSLGLTEL